MARSKRLQNLLLKSTAVLGALLVWCAAALLIGEELFLPTPWAVAARLWQMFGLPRFWLALWNTFSRILLGFLLALAAGSVLAVLAGRFRPVELLLWPYMLTVKSVPVASFVILALVWVSAAGLSALIAFLMVLPVVYGNLLSGVKAVDLQSEQMAKVFRFSLWRRIGYLWVPKLKPHLLSAVSLSLGLSYKAGVAAELIGTPRGTVGELLYDAKLGMDMPAVFAYTVAVVVLGACLEKGTVALLKGGFSLWEKQGR